MATPAAVLSVLVKTQGAQQAASELMKLDATAGRASGTLDKSSTATRKHSKVLGSLGSAAKGAGALMGAAGLAKGVSSAIDEYREAQKVGAQTNAVLKSTGGAANISKKGIENLATAISKKAGIDDEAIQKGENLLLTFTKIRNETGKGNDIFNQSTRVMTDMSVALGQDMKSSALQLGKALNNPIKGVSALQRVGVSFTEQQKKQIKTLEESGHHLDAQKIILRELKTEFGGSAAAQATSADKMKVAFGNLAESAGSILVPAIDKTARALTATITFFQEHETAAKALGISIGVVAGVMLTYKVATLAATLASQAAALATGAWTAAQWLLNAALSANPIGLVIIGIAALVAAFVIAYKKSETFRKIIDTLWDVLQTGFDWIKGHWPLLLAILTGPFGLAVLAILKYGGKIKDGVVDAFKAIVNGVKGLAGTITGLGKSVVMWVVDGIKDAASLLIAIGSWAYNRLKEGLQAYADAIRAVGGAALGWVVQGVHAAADVVINVGGWVYNRLKDGLLDVKKAFLGLGGSMLDWIVDGLKSGANKLVDFLQKIADVIGKIPGVPDITIPRFKASASGAEALAQGGVVSKPMAIVGEQAPRHKEYVIPTNPAYRGRALGLFGGLGKELGVPGFAQGGILGGLVGDLPSANGLGWLTGTGKYVLSKVGGWIKDKIGSLLGGVLGGPGIPKGDVLGSIVKGVQQAMRMDAAHTPYVYGGGHNPSFSGPWDCSGAVSAVLHSMGLLGSPITTDGLKVFGESGDGKWLTIGVRGSTGANAHTMMKIGSRYFESGSGHGAQWVSGWSGSFPIHRHPEGFAKGGILSSKLMDPKSPLFAGWGLARGGTLPFAGSFAGGGVVPGPRGRPAAAIVHGGERIGNAASDRALIEVKDGGTVNFGSPAEAHLMADRIAWRYSVGA